MIFTLILTTIKKYGEIISHTFLSHYPDYAINIIYFDETLEISSPDKSSIVLCDRDKDIAYFCQKGFPVIAFSHEGNQQEHLMGTPWLILSAEALTPDFLEEVYCRHHHFPITVCKTARCYLRELTMDDLPYLLDIQKENRENPDGCFFPEDCSAPDEFLYNYIHHQYPFYHYGIFAVLKKNTQQFLGIAGFSDSSYSFIQISYAILQKWQRLGYASETAASLISLAKERYQFPEIGVCIRQDNAASIAVAAKNHLTIHRPL